MKKYLSLLLAAIMLLSCFTAVAVAEEFPALDSNAAWDYIGDWYGVSGMDVMGDPTTDYPELQLNLFLNGLGDLYLDGGKKEVVGWYVEDGCVFLARTEDKVPKADEIFAYAYKDDTGRLVVDLMTVAVRCEQEGEEYTDVVWPEFDAEDAKYFIGTWKAVTYIIGGEEMPAELIGPMTFVLNDDGTAQSIEGEEEPYELRWYSDYSVAYLGENPTELVEITFDGEGNISVKMDAETTVIMAPFVETGTILGTWEDSSKTVEITEDGKLKMIYKSDGYTNHMQWGMVEDMPTVTLGTWKDATIVFADGKLVVDTNGLHYEFTRVGQVPAIYVGPGGFVVAEGDASEPFIGNWVEKDGLGVLTFNQDFTAVMNFNDGRVYDMNWKNTEDGAMFTSGNWFDTAMVIEDENTLNIGGDWMILYREGTQELAGDEMSEEEMLAFLAMLAEMEGMEAFTEPAAVDHVPGTMDDFIGGWICADDETMQLLLLEGEATLIEGDTGFQTTWAVVDGVAEFDGAKLYLQEDWSGIVDMYGELVKFERGYVEKLDNIVVNEGGDEEDFESIGGDEMSDEELLALLEMLAAMEGMEEGGEAASALPEGLQSYVGTWHMVYISTGGLSGDLRSMGVTGKLELNADGTGKLSGAADDSGNWYDDEGTVRFGQADTPLVLLDGGFLRYGNQLAGYMIFSQDETATWTPTAETPAVPAVPAAPETPAASRTFSSYEEYLDIKFVATTYTSFGRTEDASALGAEYSVTFHADGTCDFMMGGVPMPGLNWGLKQVALGLNQVDAFVISYGVDYNFIPNETGFDMDYFGTMTLHLVPAE